MKLNDSPATSAARNTPGHRPSARSDPAPSRIASRRDNRDGSFITDRALKRQRDERLPHINLPTESAQYPSSAAMAAEPPAAPRLRRQRVSTVARLPCDCPPPRAALQTH